MMRLSIYALISSYMLLLFSATIKRAIGFIKKDQRPDGSWYGAWGICFTYATLFALEALKSVGENYDNRYHINSYQFHFKSFYSTYVKRACDFLVSKQRPDGGWGESYKVRNIF